MTAKKQAGAGNLFRPLTARRRGVSLSQLTGYYVHGHGRNSDESR